MEKDNSLVLLNFQKIANAITSGIPEDHENNEHIDTDSELTNESDQVDEIEDDDAFFVIIIIIIIKISTWRTKR